VGWGGILLSGKNTLSNFSRSYSNLISCPLWHSFYLDMSLLAHRGMPDQAFNLYKLHFYINDNNDIYSAFTMNLEVIIQSVLRGEMSFSCVCLASVEFSRR